MRQLFKTRYTKRDPRIKAWYGTGFGKSEVILAFPSSLDRPLSRHHLVDLEELADTKWNTYFYFNGYKHRPEEVLELFATPGYSYEEVIL